MYERKIFLKIRRHFSPEKNSYLNQGGLEESALKDTTEKGAYGIKDTEDLRKMSMLQILATWK